MYLLLHIQRLYSQFVCDPFPASGPPYGENARVWVTVWVISLKWQHGFDWAAWWSEGFWRLRAAGICEAQQELWQHEKWSRAALGTKALPLPYHLASHSLGQRWRPWREAAAHHHRPGAVCVCMCLFIHRSLAGKAALNWSGRLLLHSILQPWFKWAREELKAVKCDRLKHEKERIKKKESRQREREL